MLRSPLLFAVSVLVALLSFTGVAKAADDNSLGLSFDLPATEQPIPAAKPKEKDLVLAKAAKSIDVTPRPIDNLVRPQESLPPIAAPIAAIAAIAEPVEATTETVSFKEENIGVQFLKDSLQLPNQPQDGQTVELSSNEPPPLNQLANSTDPLPQLTFDHASELIASASSQRGEPIPAETVAPALSLDDWIFEGGSQSLVAHTVGSAEGTRHWDGERTRAYYGHQDPGNGVWNLGTFSYQHEASSPEEADEKQIKRLKYQGFQLEEQAAQQGIQLSLVEKLNGLDLANQAPLAALGKGGYIERLAQAQRLALSGEEAIAWARTRSYLDPDTKSWNAPGLGNNLYSISQDQERRMLAIEKALRAYSPTDEERVALADLKNIHLQAPEETTEKTAGWADDDFNTFSDEFRLSDSEVPEANAVRPNADTPSDAISRLETASEVTFALPPVASTAPSETEVLAAEPGNDIQIALLTPAGEAAPEIESAVTTAPTEPTNSLQASATPAHTSTKTSAPDNSIPEASAPEPPVEESQHAQPAASEVELALPAPLSTLEQREDRPAPNPSWWRTEDKVVQKK